MSIAYVGPGGDRGTCDVCMRSVVEEEVVWVCHPCTWWTCNECSSARSPLPPVPRADAGEMAQLHLKTTALCVARLLEAAEERLQRLHRRWLRRRQRKSGKRDSKLANALLVAITRAGWAAQAHARAAREAAAAVAEAAAEVQAQAHQAAKAEAGSSSHEGSGGSGRGSGGGGCSGGGGVEEELQHHRSPTECCVFLG